VPVRIYALAKDLKIDSKDLVDLCTKAGIPGKGSALASLEDHEVTKLKAFMEGGAARRPAAPAPLVDTRAVLNTPVASTATLPPPPPPRPPAPGARGARPPVAPAAKTAAPEPVLPEPPAPPAKETKEAPAPVVEVAPPPPPVASPAKPIAAEASPPAPTPPPAPVAPPPPPAPIGAVRGDALVGRRAGPVRVLDNRNKRPGDGKKKEDDGPAGKGPEKRSPGVRFAAMPEVKQPTPTAKANEPKAQKPVIRLPSDVIQGTHKGALTDILRQQEKRKADQDKTGKRPDGKAGTAAPGPLGSRPTRGGKPVATEDEAGDLGKMRNARLRKPKGRMGSDDDDRGGGRRIRRQIVRTGHKSTAAPRKDKVALELPCTVRTFSEAAGIGGAQVMKALMGMGQMLNINAPIPDDLVELLVAELGVDVEIKQPESLEDKLASEFDQEDAPESLQPRPPIVTFLGHVDHGKTSLLDRLIGTNVVAGEAGGITQHIRAYSIPTKDGRRVAFVDTPGHEAFTEMRARGANVTDIAVLVVAADDGVMPQTEEAISHAKAAEVPIVVAMNKIDLPGANEQRVLEQLATAGLLPSEWGGEVEVVRTSAVTGRGMDELLETLLVTAELHEYQANPDRAASGMCLEAEQEAGRGVIAKIMVQNGTLHEGDIVVCGAAHGRVKAMYDTLKPREKVKEAGPSTPVNITGLDIPPGAGERFYVLEDIAQAREIAASRATESRHQSLAGISTRVSFEDFQKQLAEGKLGQDQEVSVLSLIIRADVRGSIEAILKELGKFDHPEVKLKVLQASVGGVTVADVTLASASGAVIIGFNVIPDEEARALADQREVEIRRYDIIYKLTDDIKAMLEGKLKPEERIVEMGRAIVKQVFTISRVGAVAGCYVAQGTIERNCRVRVNREGRTIGDYAIDTLKRVKDDVREVSRGMECGIKLVNFNDIKQDDVLEAYKIEEVARTL
jgi:translation initiation factor IF-2